MDYLNIEMKLFEKLLLIFQKVIIYQKSVPEVLLYQIKVKTKIRHQDILGTMYSLSIAPELFGDILIIDGNYYIYILPIVRNYFESTKKIRRKILLIKII